MSSKIEILSSDSLEQLRALASVSPAELLANPNKVALRHNLKFIPSEYEFEVGLKLQNPEGSAWSSNKDRENALRMFNALGDLPTIYLSDERLWVSLAFFHLHDYAKLRWPAEDSSEKVQVTALKNHWFAPTSRSRWRDHCVSRLWFVGNYAHSFEELNPNLVLDVLYLNSELINQFFGHPRTMSSPRLGATLIRNLHQIHCGSNSLDFDRNQFRKLLQLIDLRSGKINFDTISDSKLEMEISRLSEESFKS